MSTDADQLDAMILEGEKRIAEYEAYLREPHRDMDAARLMHILLLLYRGVNNLYAERMRLWESECRRAAWDEDEASAWLH